MSRVLERTKEITRSGIAVSVRLSRYMDIDS